MFTFFKISVYTAIVAFFILSLITISDVFIHSNQFRFYVLTIIAAIIFFAIGFTGIIIYKSFKNIYEYISKDNKQNSVRVSVRKLMLIFGFMAIVITLFTCSLCMGLLERMSSGTALFG
ncbi:hypothetical protein [Flavobacterium hydatis]|uniref:Uncharacterized protein n=1 Tax=Flavobacterium hydatis TaxID=991 RepID=A0A085ZDK1_FLAHY|nr:hypothetical protein [Flavobacterium hydatis]KFF02515.1 hypothetical protein IW20_25200 [Flavobacterium hydatis]OXA86327.1 hypothetical protein B0A62_23630 [Flavobacterium hydatis]